MTTNQTETRPSDEMVGKVMAKKEGWELDSIDVNDDGCFGVEIGNDATSYRPDPRDDDPAAMELLGWILTNWDKSTNTLWYQEGMWPMRLTDGSDYILGRTGQDLRYAVVRLAAKVMGIEEVEDG